MGPPNETIGKMAVKSNKTGRKQFNSLKFKWFYCTDDLNEAVDVRTGHAYPSVPGMSINS